MDSDSLNIFFIIISLILAVVIPFELFLFSYAVLGPMHYLTEINWLKSKNYFFNTNLKPAYILIGIVALISALYLIDFFNSNWLDSLKSYRRVMVTQLILTSFIFIVVFEFLQSKIGLWLCLAIAFVISLLLLKIYVGFHYLSLVFLPTLIHVYIFTGFFMIYGYTKNKQNKTLVSILMFWSVPLIIYLIPKEFLSFMTTSKAEVLYFNTGFSKINAILNQIFSEDNSIFNFKIQTFIAFAYTYHYLNWFGKTNLIGWAKAINTTQMIIILLFWSISVSLYLYDYSLGLMILFFMSLAHVLLEFPLNIKSIKSIFKLS